MRIRKRQPVPQDIPPLHHYARPPIPVVNPKVERVVVQNGCYSQTRIENQVAVSAAQLCVNNAQSETHLASRTGKIGSLPNKTREACSKSEVRIEGKQVKPCELEVVEATEDIQRTRGNQQIPKTTFEPNFIHLAARVEHDDTKSLDRDPNHPSNKPKDSLLYSLYHVFSSLSDKNVLTPREALSKIIEEGLPGLDDGIGLPSVQVAKVMRENPYFVHLEGGKFFLWSGPSVDNEDLPTDGLVSKDLSGDLNPRRNIAVNGVAKTEGEEHVQQCRSTTSGKSRARGKSASADALHKIDGVSMAEKTLLRTTAQPKASQNTANSEKAVQICKRYDGRGWKCYEKALEGYSMCRHHHELIVNRLARLRNSGRLGLAKKTPKRRKSNDKQVSSL